MVSQNDQYKDTRIVIRIPENFKSRLEAVALRNNCSMATIARLAMEQGLNLMEATGEAA